MEPYIIITDSAVDLSAEMAQELDLMIIPLTFTMAGKDYRNYLDEREMSTKEFYRRIRAGETATTAQINTMEFTEVFTPVLQSGTDILYIAFSSGLSGTYNAACLAAQGLREKFPDRKIFVVDSRAASMGQGLLVYHTVRQKRSGYPIEEAARWVEEHRDSLCHWFTVDDLNHLKRGGRISSAAALFGTMLGIKPVLHVDDDGHLIPVEKVRGRRASLDALLSHMEQTITTPEEQVIFISHGDSLQDAQYVAEQCRSRFGVQDVILHEIGPVIGAHSGPGTIALFFLGTRK